MGDREVRAKAGKERTPAEYRARARWERAQARKLRGTKYGHILAPGHIATAEAYERLAEERERDDRLVIKKLKFGSRGTRFGSAKRGGGKVRWYEVYTDRLGPTAVAYDYKGASVNVINGGRDHTEADVRRAARKAWPDAPERKRVR